MNKIAQAIWNGLTQATAIEQTATILGVLGVWLMIRRSLWAFPIGMVQVALSAKVFYDYKLYADAKLQVVFFAALAYGWWHWVFGGTERNALPITRLSRAGLIGWIGTGAAASFAWGWLLAVNTDAAAPFWDATVAGYSLCGQWLQARKKIENWSFWVGVNLLACTLYWTRELYWFSVLYGLFLLMAIGGWREWNRALKTGAAR